MVTADFDRHIGQLEWKLIVTIQALFDFNTNAGNIILSIPWKVRVCIHTHMEFVHILNTECEPCACMSHTKLAENHNQRNVHYMDEQEA